MLPFNFVCLHRRARVCMRLYIDLVRCACIFYYPIWVRMTRDGLISFARLSEEENDATSRFICPSHVRLLICQRSRAPSYSWWGFTAMKVLFYVVWWWLRWLAYLVFFALPSKWHSLIGLGGFDLFFYIIRSLRISEKWELMCVRWQRCRAADVIICKWKYHLRRKWAAVINKMCGAFIAEDIVENHSVFTNGCYGWFKIVKFRNMVKSIGFF